MRGGLQHGHRAVWAMLAVAAGLGLDPAWLLKAPLGWGSDLWDLPRAGEQKGETEAQRAPPHPLLEVTLGLQMSELLRIPQKSLRL